VLVPGPSNRSSAGDWIGQISDRFDERLPVACVLGLLADVNSTESRRARDGARSRANQELCVIGDMGRATSAEDVVHGVLQSPTNQESAGPFVCLNDFF
jgi:hypothetical protein